MAEQKNKNIIECPRVDAGQNFLNGEITSVNASNTQMGLEPPNIDTSNTQAFVGNTVSSMLSGSGLTSMLGTANAAVSNIQNIAGNATNRLKNAAQQSIASATGAAGTAVGSVVGTAMNVLGDLNQVKDMIMMSVKEVGTYAVQKVSKEVTDILTPPVALISSYTTSYLSELTAGMNSEILDKLTKPNELLSLDAFANMANGAVNGFMDDVTDKIGEISDNVNGFIEKITNEAEEISQYAMAGTTWVNNKVNKLKKDGENQISYYIDKGVNPIKKKRNEFCYNEGHRLAFAAYSKAKKAAEESTKETLDKTEQAKAKAMTKAKTAVQEATLKVMSLIGG